MVGKEAAAAGAGMAVTGRAEVATKAVMPVAEMEVD